MEPPKQRDGIPMEVRVARRCAICGEKMTIGEIGVYTWDMGLVHVFDCVAEKRGVFADKS